MKAKYVVLKERSCVETRGGKKEMYQEWENNSRSWLVFDQ